MWCCSGKPHSSVPQQQQRSSTHQRSRRQPCPHSCRQRPSRRWRSPLSPGQVDIREGGCRHRQPGRRQQSRSASSCNGSGSAYFCACALGCISGEGRSDGLTCTWGGRAAGGGQQLLPPEDCAPGSQAAGEFRCPSPHRGVPVEAAHAILVACQSRWHGPQAGGGGQPAVTLHTVVDCTPS